jgi:hypothetical protein
MGGLVQHVLSKKEPAYWMLIVEMGIEAFALVVDANVKLAGP